MAVVNRAAYEQRANTLYDAWKRQMEAAQADERLSAQGRAAALAEARTTYRKGMDALQADAGAAVAQAVADTARERKAALAKEATRRRSVLGDAVYADVVRRRVATLDSLALVAAVDDAPTDFDRELLAAYAEVEAARRNAQPERTGADMSAHGEFQKRAGQVTAGVTGMNDVEARIWLGRLDRVAADDGRAQVREEIHREF